MTKAPQSPSAHFVDEVAASVRAALADLDRRESAFRADSFSERLPDRARGRLEGNLSDWQQFLSAAAESVRTTQDDLTALDAELKQSLAAFAAARKYLQGACDQAGAAPGS
jgi:hypothetical protein